MCGSDFDEYGNERFAHPRAMRAATFLPEFMFGYPGFDWIFPAFLTIFECITLESWAEIMYMVRAVGVVPMGQVASLGLLGCVCEEGFRVLTNHRI